ncbi:hypothetical protein L218DRAFT_1077445 [Marasmius fiardii PR-910]|nr:hypothetical protein L218DRAFT_1077445 [Marasmius fiardii PR-910]
MSQLQDRPLYFTLFTSNDPPSATELSLLTREYKDTLRTISSLDHDIVLLQQQVHSLQAKQRQLSSSVTFYKHILHPCRRLPNEVLAMIFTTCVDKEGLRTRKPLKPMSRSTEFPSTFDTKKSPWILGQVCRRWRYLVLSLAELWTTIDINWEGLPTEISDPFIERRLSLTLQRSHDEPLHVSWGQQSCRDRTFLSMVASRSLRWKSATIRAGLKGLRLLTPYSGAFPILSTLYLDFAEENWLGLDKNDPVFHIFRDAPSLRNVTLTGDWTVTPRLSSQIPWNQVKRFAVEPDYLETWRDFQILLPYLTNVEEMTLKRFGFDGFRDTPLLMERLHTLDLRTADTLSIDQLLGSLTLPSLHKLVVSSALTATPSILAFLGRSACQLEECGVLSEEGANLVNLLKSESLQTVHTCSIRGTSFTAVENYAISDASLSALQLRPSGKSNLLPHITELDLAGEHKKWSDKALVDMLASRRDIEQFLPGSVSRLQHVKFSEWFPTLLRLRDVFVMRDAEAASRLRRLVEGGLTINDGDMRVLLK